MNAGLYPSDSVARTILIPLCAQAVDGGIATGVMHPWCSLCASPRERWTFSVERTPWATMEEAMPKLQAIEVEQNRIHQAHGKY